MKVLSDLYLVASDGSTEPTGPSGYTSIGYWDVDSGGSHGTDGSTGDYMMALYAKFIEVDSLANINRIEDVFLTASNNLTPTPPSNGSFHNIGYWDVDSGGSVGTNGSKGSYMMGMFTRQNEGSNVYISDIVLTASNRDFPTILDDNSDYRLVGYWDVDNGGSVGTNGDNGSSMMGLFIQSSLVQ